jgi:hypothetical protein
LVPVKRRVFVPQATTIILHIKIHVTIRLLLYGNGVLISQPIKVNSYPLRGGEPFGGSPNGGSPRGGSLDRNPHGLPSNPHVGFYGWQTPNPRIFMPLWYQLVLVLSNQPICCHTKSSNIPHM